MDLEGTWAEMPEVPTPEECTRRETRLVTSGDTLPDRLDVRLATGRLLSEMPGPGMPGGRSALWAKMPDILEMSSASLAVLGDYVPFGIGQALGMPVGGNSLDNTLRIGGDLLATASQSTIVRMWNLPSAGGGGGRPD
jgi:hypothetical protein